MKKIHDALLILPLLASLLMAGCGGGDSFSVAEGGIGGTGISTGTVTGIGSVTVNGVKFNTDNAAIYIEGVRVDDPNLADGDELSLRGFGFNEGQVVRVVGSFNDDGKTGVADAVYYNDSIEGPVVSVTPIDGNTSEVIVMGQNIIVDSKTILDDAPTISPNDLIEVSGLRDDTGKIRAGYINNITVSGQDPDSSTENEVKGIIDNVPGNFKFMIGNLTVDYSTADTSDIPGGTPIVGMQVEVKGLFNGGELAATRVELEDDISGKDDDDVEYEGIVTSAPVPFVTGNTFVMGIQTIQTNSNTVYKSGLAEDITAGVRLEAEGYLQNGILLADEIRFRDVIEVDATVLNYDDQTKLIQLDLGPDILTIQVNELTKVGDDANDLNQLENLLANGNLNDFVEVRGRVLSGNVVFAEEIKIKDGADNPDVKLQGPIENDPVVDPLVTILGIDIDVGVHNITEYENANDLPIGRTTFFNTVITGNIVSAEGKLDGLGGLDWDKLEIEDEE
jgi:hypothetical protein